NREREQSGEPPFANPRNAAAGTMRNLDPALVSKRGLSAFTYQIIPSNPPKGGSHVPDNPPKGGSCVPQSHAAMLTAMRDWGLPVESHWRRCEGVDSVIAFCQEWADKRHALEFDTDGRAIKVDDLAIRDRLGATEKVPRWATT